MTEQNGKAGRTETKVALNSKGLSRGRKAASALLAIASLGALSGLTACTRDYTVAYVYATSSRANPGVLNAYAVDFQTGALNALADSGVAVGRNPVAVVASPSGLNLYVLNHDDSSIQVFSIGTDGKVYSQQTVNTNLGVFPVAAAVDPTGSFLYVVYTLTPPTSSTTLAGTGPGELQVLPISPQSASIPGGLGAPIVNTTIGTTSANPLNYFPVGNNPSGVAVSFTGGVYVIDQEPSGTGLITAGPTGSAAGPTGILLAFQEVSSGTGAAGTIVPTGQLTLAPGTVITPVATGGYTAAGVQAGTVPRAIATTPNGRFIYVVDQAQNLLYAYLLTSNGTPVAIPNGPYATGQFPVAVTVDPRGSYIYVANFNESSVTPYAINTATGAPGAVTGGIARVGTNPNCVTIEPARGIYLYTANFLDSTLSGLQLSANTGQLINIQSTPFPAQALPTSCVAVANGSRATQLVNP